MIYDLSFNICFIGTYSFTLYQIRRYVNKLPVLILVLLELILLHFDLPLSNPLAGLSFNPCFIGTYSFTSNSLFCSLYFHFVLILVLLELILLREAK